MGEVQEQVIATKVLSECCSYKQVIDHDHRHSLFSSERHIGGGGGNVHQPRYLPE